MKYATIRAGDVQVGPFMLALGVFVHLLLPLGLLYVAWRIDAAYGLSLGLPLYLRAPVGVGVFALSVWIEARAIPVFFRSGGSPSPFQPTRALVIAGPYRYCRHPIYIAYIGYVIGPGLALNLVSAFATAAVFLAFLAATAKFHEEPKLRRRFGEEFEAYRRRTPFMIPRWRRY